MHASANEPTDTLVVSDSNSITELVEKNLFGEFTHLSYSHDPAHWADALEESGARIILLAFEQLDQAVHCRQVLIDGMTTPGTCRFLTLCDKREVQHAYELCRQRIFTDYIVFWPLSFDPPRLRMTLHQAIDAHSSPSSAPSTATTSSATAPLASVQRLLDQQLTTTEQRLTQVGRLVEIAETDVQAAIEQTYQQLLALAGSGNRAADAELDRNAMQNRFHVLTQALRNIFDWSSEFSQVTAHHRALAEKMFPSEQQIKSLLIVDDDDFQREVIRQLLKDEPYHLEFAHSGEAALDMLLRKVPDLILMDIMMSGIDGIEVTRQISSHPQFQHIPIVMITSHNERDVVVECLKAGATDFIVKPYNQKTLVSKISKALPNP